jgi:hypothetical protein
MDKALIKDCGRCSKELIELKIDNLLEISRKCFHDPGDYWKVGNSIVLEEALNLTIPMELQPDDEDK